MFLTYYFIFLFIDLFIFYFFFFQAEDGIRDKLVTGVQTCALPNGRGSFPPTSNSAMSMNWRRNIHRLRPMSAPSRMPSGRMWVRLRAAAASPFSPLAPRSTRGSAQAAGQR